jgi:hypothetical protein
MSESPDLPVISEEELATFRRCRFARRVFHPRDCYRSREPVDDFLEFAEEWEEQGTSFSTTTRGSRSFPAAGTTNTVTSAGGEWSKG